MMRHGALFNGIGGFQLAAHWMGWDNVMHCEIDEFCNKVVKKHFPNSIQHGDIKTTDFKKYRGAIDILTGGFPCQPFSTAGQRKGTADDRHLWPEMLRAIREISPPWVVGENVRGLTNWSKGLVFDQVQADLEAEGYEVLPFLFPACAVNAPHRRDRIWFVANSDRFRCGEQKIFSEQQRGAKTFSTGKAGLPGIGKELASSNTNGNADKWQNGFGQDRCKEEKGKGQENKRQRVRDGFNGNDAERVVAESDSRKYNEFGPFTQSPVCGGDDGFSDILDQLKSLGNAIVPHAALQIFKAIEQYEKL